ncbi:MAG TPA: T9SS type A sorting domain-containing protein [Flavobacteriales bacterium]
MLHMHSRVDTSTPFIRTVQGKRLTRWVLLSIVLAVLAVKAGAQTNTYTAATGNWSTAANWSLAHIPIAGEQVVIPAGRSVTIDATTIPASGTIASLTIGGTLTYSAATARTISVAGQVQIDAGGTFASAATGAVVTHRLLVGGNILNNGTLDFSTSTGGNSAAAVITFNTASVQLFSGTGGTTDLYSIVMAKTALDPTGATNLVEFDLTNFSVRGQSTSATGALLTTNTGTGLLKFSGSNSFSGVLWSAAAYTIPANLGLWLNNPSFTVTAQAGTATLTGYLRVDAGTYNVGTLAAHNLTCNATATTKGINISGGAVNISGKYTMSGTGTYDQSGGTLTVGLVPNSVTGAMFSTAAGNAFQMSNGTIVVQNANTATTPIDCNILSTTMSVGQGTLQLGNAATPAMSTFRIQGKVPNVRLDNSSSTDPALSLSGALTVLGEMTLHGAGGFNKGAVALTLEGNSVRNGNLIVSGTNALLLNGSTTAATGLFFTGTAGNQRIALGSGSLTDNELPSITVNNTYANGTVTLPSGSAMRSGTTLTLTEGDLMIGENGTGSIVYGTATSGTFTCIRTMGSLTAASSAFGSGVTTKAYTYNGTGTQTSGNELPTGGAADIHTLTIANAALVLELAQPVNVWTTLTLTNGVVRTTAMETLRCGTATAAATLSGGSATAYVEGPFLRTFAASRNASGTYNATTLFPVGRAGVYRPMHLDPTTTSGGAVQLAAEFHGVNSGTNVSPAGTVDDDHQWRAWNAGAANLTSVRVRITAAPLTAMDLLLASTAQNGTFAPVAPAVTFAAGILTTNTAITATELADRPWFAFGQGCLAVNLPVLTGPLDICAGSSSLVLCNDSISAWSSTDPVLAGVVATPGTTARIQGLAAGLVPVTYTVQMANTAAGRACQGVTGSTTFRIQTCATLPGGVGNDLVSWYKGNDGASTSAWSDRIGPNDMSAVSGTMGTATINFNPAPSFNGTAYYDIAAPQGWLGGRQASTVYYVAHTATGGWRVVYGKGGANSIGASQHSGVSGGGTDRFFTSNTSTTQSAAITSGAGWNITPHALVRSSHDDANGRFAMTANGGAEAYGPSVTQNVGASSAFRIGSSVGTASAKWLGPIGEVIVFNSYPSASEERRVNSYLALKYGISLDQSVPQDYVASDGTTLMWNATLAGAFNRNIFGIGRDQASGLDQRISRSMATDAILTISTDSDMSNNSPAHAPLATDKQFLTVADNGGNARWTVTGAPSGYYPMLRQWKTTNTGGVGTVHVQFQTDLPTFDVPPLLWGTSYVVLTDPNADGNFADGQVIPLTDAGAGLWKGSLALPSGTVFTLGTPRVALAAKPGGVHTPSIWLRSDEVSGMTDGQPLTNWPDRSGSRITNALGTGEMSSPTFQDDAEGVINYHPSIHFNGVDNGLNFGDDLFRATNATGGVHMFGVARPTATGPGKLYPLIMDVGGITGDGYGFAYGTYYCSGYAPTNTGGAQQTVPNASLAERAAVIDLDIDFTGYGGLQSLHVNGNTVAANNIGLSNLDWSVNMVPAHVGPGGPFTIGRSSKNDNMGGNDNRAFQGFLGEVVHYNRNLTATETQRVLSYLAIKYGLTMGDQSGAAAGNYLLSDGTLAWSAAAGPTYQNNIIGVARDDASGLLQKQSHTADDTVRIHLATPTALNQDNPAVIAGDRQAVLIGDNALPLRSNGSTEFPAGVGIFSRLDREWKVTNTAFPGTFTLDIRLNTGAAVIAADLRLLVDDDGDFTNAVLFNKAMSYAGGVLTIDAMSTAEIPMGATRYFTIVSMFSSSPLPVELLEFNARPVGEQRVHLTWSTASEHNSYHFTVERSADIADWTDVCRTDAAVNSTQVLDYDCYDGNALLGVSYYRLVQTDLDGAQHRSDVRVVDLGRSNKALMGEKLFVYPNPTTGTVTILGTAAELSGWRVFDTMGRDVTGSIQQKGYSEGRLQLDLTALSSGLYTVRTANGYATIQRKP